MATSAPLSTLLPQTYTPARAVSPLLDFIHNSGALNNLRLCYNINIRASEQIKQYGLLGLELQLAFLDGKYQITIKNTGSFLIKIVEALFTILDDDEEEELEECDEDNEGEEVGEDDGMDIDADYDDAIGQADVNDPHFFYPTHKTT